MFRSASLSSGQALSAFTVYKFDKWKYKNLRMTGILLRISYPITVTVGTWTVLAFASLVVAILNASLGSFTLSYGSASQYKPYVAVQGAELRNVHRFVMQRECPNTLPTANVAVGTYTWTIDLEVPFHVPNLLGGRKRIPGYSQIRTLQLEMIEGAAFTNTATGVAARTGGANVTIDVDPLTMTGSDQWSPILSYYKVNTADFEAVGPDGTHLGAWDDNAGFAATAIQLFSLFFDGETHTESMPPYAPDDRYIEDWVEGGITPAQEAAIDDTETVVLSPEINMDVQDLPHGRISLKLPSMYVATIKLRGLYWPAMQLAEAQEAATTSADQNRAGVLLSVDSDAAYASEKAARTFAAQVYTIDKPGATLLPGITVPQPGVVPQVSVPPHIKSAITSSIDQAGQSGVATRQAAQAASLTNVAKLVPGFAQTAASVANAPSAQRVAVIQDVFQRQGGVAV